MKFIFATTEPHKLPDTILSRCQRHDFRRIPAERMLERLKQIATEEKAGTVRRLARAHRPPGRGRHARRALAARPGDVRRAARAPPTPRWPRRSAPSTAPWSSRWPPRWSAATPSALLETVDEVFNRGVDLRRLAEELALELRHVFVTRATGKAPAELAEVEQTTVVELAREADAAQLARLFDVVHGSVWDVGRAAQPRLALEMALLKAVQLAPTASIPELLGRVEKLLGPGAAPDRARPLAPAGRLEVVPLPGPFRV